MPEYSFISTHTPLAGRDLWHYILWELELISTHTPLAGRDPWAIRSRYFFGNFNSHAPRGARRSKFFKICKTLHISTHTPLAGRDQRAGFGVVFRVISTHTPLAGRDRTERSTSSGTMKFQLTRPSRGATAVCFADCVQQGISTHTPLAGRDGEANAALDLYEDFNSHAPRGARPAAFSTLAVEISFQLTRPSRGATRIQ